MGLGRGRRRVEGEQERKRGRGEEREVLILAEIQLFDIIGTSRAGSRALPLVKVAAADLSFYGQEFIPNLLGLRGWCWIETIYSRHR
jgi:hypothetical protein